MRKPTGIAATVFAAVIATGCSGSSSTDATASRKPLPATGCSLLDPAEVSAFLGTASTCQPIRSNTSKQEVVAAGWQTARGDQTVKAGVSRTNVAEDKETFEDDAARSNAAAKTLAGVGDDAELVVDPNAPASGSIMILRGNDVIIVTVTHGNLRGGRLTRALTAAGRRIVATY